ncbi:MAG TPA: hypothetical protein VNZ53_31665 [Steroidobacteraceae bacterium]|nr:hypothetical protein [Steroidobacteraceae bacterium]
MLDGTTRKPAEIIGDVAPNLSPITLEKVAVNAAVPSTCPPLSALEAALDPLFTMHGLLRTNCFSGPIVVVNGPIPKEIEMNSGINCLGQGNRANATEPSSAVLEKYPFCFAEDESDPTWMPLSVARGLPKGKNAVALFQGDGMFGALRDHEAPNWSPVPWCRECATALMRRKFAASPVSNTILWIRTFSPLDFICVAVF